jgi:hypothetical protein
MGHLLAIFLLAPILIAFYRMRRKRTPGEFALAALAGTRLRS